MRALPALVLLLVGVALALASRPVAGPDREAAHAAKIAATMQVAKVKTERFKRSRSLRVGRGAWTYFTDPRAVGDARRTYTGWISPAGWVHVAQVDWQRSRVTTVRLGPRLTRDDHNNPALLLRPDGRLTVFYSAHSGVRLTGSSTRALWTRTTVKPHDLTRWQPTDQVGTNVAGDLGYTYPNPIAFSGGRTWLAWRGANWMPTFSLQSDGTWQQAQNLLSPDDASRTKIRGEMPHRPYTKYAKGGGGRVHMAYTDGHPYEDRTSLYYASLAPTSGEARKADGTAIADGESPFTADHGERVYDWKEHGNAWVMDVVDDGAGRPMILYTTGWSRFTVIRFRVAHWDGRRWLDREIATASDAPRASRRGYGHRFFSGAGTFNPNDPAEIYLSRGIDRRYRVELWRADSGLDYRQRAVISPEDKSCFRPAGVHGGGPQTVVFACGAHRGWRHYRSSVHVVRPGDKARR